LRSPWGRHRRHHRPPHRRPRPRERPAIARAVALDLRDAAGAIREHAPHGVDRIERPALPFRPMLVANLTIRLPGSDDFRR